MSRTDTLNDNIANGLEEVEVILRRQKRLQRGIVSEYVDRGRLATSAAERNIMYADISNEYSEFATNIDGWIGKNVKRTAKSFWGYARDDIDGSVIKWGEFEEDDLPNIIESVIPETTEEQTGGENRSAAILAALLWLMKTASSTAINEGMLSDIASGTAHAGGLTDIASLIWSDYESTGAIPSSISKATAAKVAKKMEDDLTKIAGQMFYIDSAGKKWTADNYFKTLNRTMHAEAARGAYSKTAQKAGNDLFVIAGGVTGSSRKYPNDPCDDWAGRVFSMSGKTAGYPSYSDVISVGVFHPNCVHYMRVASNEELK